MRFKDLGETEISTIAAVLADLSIFAAEKGPIELAPLRNPQLADVYWRWTLGLRGSGISPTDIPEEAKRLLTPGLIYARLDYVPEKCLQRIDLKVDHPVIGSYTCAVEYEREWKHIPRAVIEALLHSEGVRMNLYRDLDTDT